MISLSIPCNKYVSSEKLFQLISLKLVEMNMAEIILKFDGNLLYIDSFEARVWIDIFNIETTLSDLKDTASGELLILSNFLDKNEDDVLYKYMYDISSKSRDFETLNIMNKLAFLLSKYENSFIFDDNGLLGANKGIYSPEEMMEFIK
ncbi:hypothetical protein [Acinetobacter wuhouensis]|uniref:Uncharacterized protein n=1 Tax=Acinetobacter wuhouensis TaxID=1879050 RepID=A0A3G2T6W5_9GAMM|nr:hypothetical protein [Acinetobacter wuhouensis]AYO55246.1 hypothetical protein CDG68_16985 [Acinetobacter wuhouensis]